MSKPDPVDTNRPYPATTPIVETAETTGMSSLGQTGPPSFTRSEIENIDRLLPYLSYVDGQLSVSGVPLTRYWDGSRSLLLYLPQRAVDNYRSIQAAFERRFNVQINCAIKACYVGGVLLALRAAGVGVEIASELEWRIASRIGFPPERTVVNGMCRSSDETERLLRHEALLIDIDSQAELERLEWHAALHGVKPKVLVRVNPLRADAFFSERSKLGMGPDEAYQLLERAARSAHLDLRGLHAHQLVRCTSPEQFALLAARMADLRTAFGKANGKRLETLDLGGGLETRYLLERAGNTVEDFASAAYDALAGARDVQLLLEPGRYIFGDAALALTEVLGTKTKAGHDWLITHVGCNLLPPTSDRAYPPLPIRLEDEQAWKRCHVADPTPAPSRLCLDASLPSDAPEHGLVLIGCGAYTAVRASLWSTDLPDIAFLDGGIAETVFDRSGQDSVFQAMYGVDLNDAS